MRGCPRRDAGHHRGMPCAAARRFRVTRRTRYPASGYADAVDHLGQRPGQRMQVRAARESRAGGAGALVTPIAIA